MPAITDPMNALVSLQAALKRGEVTMQPCDIHPDLQVLLDSPEGTMRMTYAARTGKGVVQAIAIFSPVEPVDDVPCFGIGYAVAEPFRGNGLANRIISNALDELRTGLSRNGVRQFNIEAIVATSNHPSNAVARKLLSDSPVAGTDSISGEPILQYVKLVN